ncbi:CheY-like chemotaxis protein [Undibacterium sp. GrIS 1.8]|uniref:response regulator n=1 Tax=Undibacterium sp. GrIS 1.8 TaxID=3143934 RepID=UPI0033985BC7
MSEKNPTIAIRLIGFTPKENDTFSTVLAVMREKGYRYLCLRDGSLQDPDLFIVNAEDMKALATLSDINPGHAQPVLLIGKTKVSLPYAVMPRPIRWRKLFDVLDELVDERQLLLTTLSAYGEVAIPERRRRERLDFDLTDPSVYQKMRNSATPRGGILIIDKDMRFRDYVAAIMERYNIPVGMSNDAETALSLDAQYQYGLTMINTSTPDIDPYGLCRSLKGQNEHRKTNVMFLIDKTFVYNQEFAQSVSCDGFLNKPLSRKLVLSTIQKFLQLT